MTEKVLVHAPVQVLAIDPGKSGAVARIGKGCFDVLRNFKDLQSIALAIADLARGCDVGVIENVHAMPGQGVVSMFTFGKSTGVAFGALFLALAKTAPLLEVAPLKWQNFFRSELGVDKSVPFDSRLVATMLFPSYAPPYLKRKLDHNSGDAILMAAWLLLNDSLISSGAEDLKNESRHSAARGQRGQKKRKASCGRPPSESRSFSTTSQEKTEAPGSSSPVQSSTPEAL